MRLFGWSKKSNPERPKIPVVPQQPVLVDDVPAAPVPNPKLEAESKALQLELIQSLFTLGRSSAELKDTLARAALNSLNGGKTLC